MQTVKEFLKDCILFIALIFLVSYAVKRLQSFLTLHRNSIIHELDQKFIDKLYQCQRQTRTVAEMIERGSIEASFAQTLEKIQKDLLFVEEKFSKNSPSLLLLGPIGTTSIIMKERSLEQKLLFIAKNMSTLLADIAKNYDLTNISIQESESLDYYLKNNQRIITDLRRLFGMIRTPKVSQKLPIAGNTPLNR